MSNSEVSSTSPRSKLEVTAPVGSEVTVLDSGLRSVARGLGSTSFELSEGIYKVNVSAGRLTVEKVVILRSGPERVSFSDADLAYYSPVPLATTHKVNAAHVREATAHSRERHAQVGNGSSIFVFARGYDSPGVNPAHGLWLTSRDGDKLVDIQAQGASWQETARPCAACAIELDPGVYRLRLETEVRVLEQTIVASPGFQTQVFLPQRSLEVKDATDASLKSIVAADLLRASILMSGGAFEAADLDSRLDDLARIALADNRALTQADLRSLFNREHRNPMFGIYAGHLLLLLQEPDLDLLNEVVAFLRSRLSMPHPDVEALALELGEPSQPRQNLFATPPMLASSWKLVAKHSASNMDLVAKGSFSARAAAARWGTGPWYVWDARALGDDPTDESDDDDSNALESLEAVTTETGNRVAYSQVRPDALALIDAVSEAQGLSSLEAAMYRALQRGSLAVREKKLSFEAISRNIGVPLATVRQAASGLSRKLSRERIQRLDLQSSEGLSARTPAAMPFGSCVEWVPEIDSGAGTERPALARQFQWSNGSTIRCAFIDGDPQVHQRVREVAKVWERYANLTFAFTPNVDKADVRITFARAGASSVLGTACKRVPRQEATMVLGDVGLATSVEEVWRLVLHEFGHAIGLIHEHQNPAGGIHWNKPIAEEYYRKLTGWETDKIERNIFRAYEKDVTQFAFTDVDRTSIMMYPIPKQLTTNGFEVGWNRTLSRVDAEFVRQMYPGRLRENPPEVPKTFSSAPLPPASPAPAVSAAGALGNSAPPTTSEKVDSRMQAIQDQLRRIREFNSKLRGADKQLNDELPQVGAAAGDLALEAFTPESSLDAKLELETIVLRRGRPVLTISNDTTLLVFRDKDDSAVWKERLTSARGAIDGAVRAVGRIEVSGHALSWLGTGWLVASDVVVTNRHVAREFTIRRGQSFVFRMADSGEGPMKASVDFLQEYDNPRTLTFRLVRPLYVEADGGPDLAFFEVEQQSGSGTLAQPIQLSSGAPSVTPSVAVIGYPASDSRIPDYDLMIRTFGTVFDKKRLAPGGVTRVEGTQILHDCSTLGGNSGSVVLDLSRGEAVGLHFSGRFLTANYAVRADLVRRRLNELKSGDLGRARRVAIPTRITQPEAAAPVVAVPSGAVSITIPLVVTLSVGTPGNGSMVPALVAKSPSPAPSAVPLAADDTEEDLDEGLEGLVVDYADRRGYEAAFLGKQRSIQLPEVARDANDVLGFDVDGKSETVLRYEHFSVVMSRRRRMCFFSAVNIDGAVSRKTRRGAWRWDPRIPKAQQIMKECYGSPPKFSRGHMTRREDPGWGSPTTATRGADDSMHVTNAVPQMQAFNSPIWLELEDYALQNAREDDMKISVFTGPFFTERDPIRHGVKIPTSFWKIIAFLHDETGELSATGYIMEQDEQLPEEEFVFGQFTSSHLNKTVQVPISRIEKRAGIRFDGLAEHDVFGADEEGVGGATAQHVVLSSLEQIRFAR